MSLRQPIYAAPKPLPIPRLGKITKALETLYGKNLTMTDAGVVFVFWTQGDECPCQECDERVQHIIEANPEIGWWTGSGMIVCPDCGNKRCPQAASHDYWCSRSNVPDQVRLHKAFDPDPLAAAVKEEQ